MTITKMTEIIPIEPEITNEPQALAWNVEEIKKYLEAITEKYQGLVVTEENELEMQKTLREIVSLRTKFGKFERKGKDLLRRPMNEFLNQCEILSSVIADVEKPLRDQLQVYEDKRIEELNVSIEREIELKAQAAGLFPEYLRDFQRNEKWLNKTQKYSHTLVDIDKEIERLLAAQKAEQEREKMLAERESYITMAVELANSKLQSPLLISRYLELDPDEYSFSDVKKMIEKDGQRQQEIEATAMEAAKQKAAEEQRKIEEEKKKQEETQQIEDVKNIPEFGTKITHEEPLPEEVMEILDTEEKTLAELESERKIEISLLTATIVIHDIPANKLEDLYNSLDFLGYQYDVKGVE